jgi:hypothetical protein
MFARGGSTVECPVPWEQQPVNEYQMLNETGLFAWATDPLLSFGIRISAVTVGVSALVGYPIVSLSINAEQEFLKCCMGALCGGILAATVVTLRLYLGWAYIGNRLFSATVECKTPFPSPSPSTSTIVYLHSIEPGSSVELLSNMVLFAFCR